jgi:hypothetical protein
LNEEKEDPKFFMARINAARMGCAVCSAAVRVPPAGDPFSKGPYIGRYWCGDCWTLYWDEHPDHLADEESRNYVREEAKRIRLKRGSQIIFEEGENRVFRTAKGTIVFDFRTSKELALNEYDAPRMTILLRALKAIEAKKQEVSAAG